MPKYWTDLVNRLTPYVPGEQRSGDNVVKLNTNENPYPPSDLVSQAIASVPSGELRRYPDPNAIGLRQSLADYHDLNIDQVFVGNGSDEILALAFMAFFTGDKPLQFPVVSYSFYPVYCDLLNIKPQKTALDENFNVRPGQFSAECGGIVFPNPNAPTALAMPRESIEQILSQHADKVVLVDEAYADFGAHSVIDLINRYPNLVVSRTFSKGRSLAGMRIGAAFADANLIEGLRRVKDSFNSYPLDALAQAAAVASLKDEPYYRGTIKKIMATRERVTQELEKRNYRVLPSAANFIFASPPDQNAKKVFDGLNEQNVLVRYWDKPPLNDWLRITIGTDAEMDLFFAALEKIV